MVKFITCLFLFVGVLFANSVLIPELKAIVLVGDKEKLESIEYASGIEFIDLKLPGKESNLKRALIPFLGEKITKEDIENIKWKIIDYYRDENHPLVFVCVPNQKVTSGILRLLVIESRVGEIKVVNNRWVSTKTIKSYLHLKSGDRVDESDLLTDVNFINRNPFRRVDVMYAKGKKYGTTDIELYTQDYFPFRIYAGSDNSGLKDIGKERWYAGFNWGNFFGMDQLFSYRYTTSFNLHEMQAHTFNLVAPLFMKNSLTLFGGFSNVNFKDQNNKNCHGKSYQASGRYSIPFFLRENRTNEFTLGFDFKRTNNTAEEENEAIRSLAFADIGQFFTGYSYEESINRWKLNLNMELFFSPVKIFEHQNSGDYELLRLGAKPYYVYGKITTVNLIRLPEDFYISLILTGQYSSQNLLPSEQFGLGGYNTVRGYNYRYVNGDNAFLTNLEFRTPSFSFLKGNLQFILFTDYGLAGNHKRVSDEDKYWQLWGAGPGLRFVIDPYLRIYVDWGIRLIDANYNGGYNNNKEPNPREKLHFGVNLSY